MSVQGLNFRNNAMQILSFEALSSINVLTVSDGPEIPTEHYQLAQGSLSHVGRPIMERNMIELADRKEKEKKGIENENQYVLRLVPSFGIIALC